MTFQKYDCIYYHVNIVREGLCGPTHLNILFVQIILTLALIILELDVIVMLNISFGKKCIHLFSLFSDIMAMNIFNSHCFQLCQIKIVLYRKKCNESQKYKNALLSSLKTII